MDDTLLNRLKSMGVKLGEAHSPKLDRGNRYPIDHVLTGEVVQNSFGECFVVSKEYPRDYIHGNVDLFSRAGIGFIAQYANLPQLATASSENLVFLDTETTGLSQSAGTFPFLTGLCKSTPDGTCVRLLFCRNPTEEPAMLEEIGKYIFGVDAVVTYNGKSFDIPLLESRYSYHAQQSPFGSMGHIDLLHMARRLWKKTLPSRSLGYVEMSILAVARSDQEVPGYLIPQLYYDYLKTGDARPLASVLYHNEMDILSLVALLNHLVDLSMDDIFKLNPDDVLSVAAMLMNVDNLDAFIPTIHAVLEMEEDGLDWSQYHRITDWVKKKQSWNYTILLLEKAARNDQLWAQLELAKYYENHAKSYDQALYWCEQMLQTIERQSLAPYSQKSSLLEINRRLQRIQSRSNK